MMRRYKLDVYLNLPDDLTNKQVADFVTEELTAAGGNRMPNDPFFGDIIDGIERDVKVFVERIGKIIVQ